MDNYNNEFKDKMYFNTHLFTNLGMFQLDEKGQNSLNENWIDFVKYDYLGEKREEVKPLSKEELNDRVKRLEAITKKIDMAKNGKTKIFN